MSWDRFHYLCRKYNQLNQNGIEFSRVLHDIENTKSTNLYGSKIEVNSIANEILNILRVSKDSHFIKEATYIYARLNFTKALQEPPKFKGVVTYLIFLTSVYLILSLIYQMFVMPQFLSMFETLSITPPDSFSWYMNYSFHISAVIISLLILSMFIFNQIKLMFSLEAYKQESFVYKFLIPKSIKNNYLSIIEIILFPVSSYFEKHDNEQSEISLHLKNTKNSIEFTISEIESLLEIETKKLCNNIEKFVIYILALISFIIVASIFVFIISAYTPIFVMEEAL